MATAKLPEIVDNLRESRLLTDEQQEEVNAGLQSGFADPEALTAELERRGWLTDYQRRQLLAGRGKDLTYGQYILLDLLGEGGMGQVFKARHRIMKRVAALKVVRKECLANQAAVKRFIREIEAVALLQHANIVIAYDADQIGDNLYFVMEYVEGADLGKLIKQHGALPVGEACEYIRQAALGLQHAHERGLVHRDIKPSNLLLTTMAARPGSSPDIIKQQGDIKLEPVIKILDMGLARLRERSDGVKDETELTQQGMVMGTPDYMSPEQARNSHNVDIRADIYSLGCTLYYLLAGRVVFPTETITEKLYKHWFEEPQPIEQLCPAVPSGLGAIIRKAMAKRPEDRYHHPGQLAAALAPYCKVEADSLVAFRAPLSPQDVQTLSSDDFIKLARAGHTPVPSQAETNTQQGMQPPHASGHPPVSATARDRPPGPVETSRDTQGTDVSSATYRPPVGQVVRTMPGGGPGQPSVTPPLPPDRLQGTMLSSDLIIASGMGGPPSQQTPAWQPPPGPSPRRANPLILGSIVAGIVLLLTTASGLILFGNFGSNMHAAGTTSSTEDGKTTPKDTTLTPTTSRPVLPKPPEKYALLIGVSNYGDKNIRPLPFAKSDLTELADTLQGTGSYKRENLTILPSEKAAPTRDEILKALKSQCDRCQPKDSLLIAWEGHVVKFKNDEQVYLCPEDAVLSKDDRGSLIPLAEIYKALESCKAGFKLLLVDGFREAIFAKGAPEDLNLETVAQPQRLDPPANVAVLFACQAGQFGNDHATLPNSAFIHAVSNALAGKTDVDLEERCRLLMRDYFKGQEQIPDPVRVGTTGADVAAPFTSMQTFTKPSATDRVTKIPHVPWRPGHVKSWHLIDRLRHIAIAPDCSRLVYAKFRDVDYVVYLWDIVKGKEIDQQAVLSTNYPGFIQSLAISPDGKKAISGHGGVMSSAAKGDVLLEKYYSRGKDFLLRYYEFGVRTAPRDFDKFANFRTTAHTDEVISVVFSSDGKKAFSASKDGTVRFWDVDKATEISEFRLKDTWASAVAVPPGDPSTFLAAGHDMVIYLCDTFNPKGDPIKFKGHKGSVRCVTYSPNGKFALSGSQDATLRYWDLAKKGEDSMVLKDDKDGHKGAINCVAISSNGFWALSGGADHSVRLWNLKTGKQVTSFPGEADGAKGHKGSVIYVIFSPDGKQAYSASEDGTLRKWNLPKVENRE